MLRLGQVNVKVVKGWEDGSVPGGWREGPGYLLETEQYWALPWCTQIPAEPGGQVI